MQKVREEAIMPRSITLMSMAFTRDEDQAHERRLRYGHVTESEPMRHSEAGGRQPNACTTEGSYATGPCPPRYFPQGHAQRLAYLML